MASRTLIKFPNIPFRVMKTGKVYGQTGSEDLKRVIFKVRPNITKPEIKEYLNRVYGIPVVNVNTINVEFYRKRTRRGMVRNPNFKKAIVTYEATEGVAEGLQE
eukprot:TRINITY_DN17213_c0_g1_i1.p1 TRINITY_DN17213_c0_g1~~TRINITY_DN17213_c0_g1_i1.p1  ORF type:complete len:121 (+),score=26.69 TRINITY_DN17213_c0_g1_i1:52-363(+)